MKKKFLMGAVFAAFLGIASAPAAHAGACFDWSCDGSGSRACTFDASCSTLSPYVWKYNFDFGDGTGTGLTGTAVWNHTYSSGYSSTVSLTVTSFSGSSTVNCTVWTHVLPVGPQPPMSGRCQ